MGNLSHSSITRRIRTILLVALVLASTTTYLIALVSGYHYIDKLFEDKVQNLFTSIENELVMFDHALTLVEQDWEIELRDNLPKIAQELKSGQYQLEELEAKTLKEMALRHFL